MSKNELKVVAVGLCASRHEMPVSEFIFPESVNPTDFKMMDDTVKSFIESHIDDLELDHRYTVPLNGTGEEAECFQSKGRLVLYVTGLTACVATVIRICAINGIALTLMHFDRESGEYIPQIIF